MDNPFVQVLVYRGSETFTQVINLNKVTQFWFRDEKMDRIMVSFGREHSIAIAAEAGSFFLEMLAGGKKEKPAKKTSRAVKEN
jgi:hypothetical protein